ncbi:diaminopropionate ammonia-lyase [Mesorhizobium sp. L-8-10]|uniref:diaminopropionate ammonia-lyase n=1 Tax=Mesorhizobium sp. L-8-10 TaxID=2744523 RepID=UPI00193692C7|nr:diaminopropionate ammonia-lyase [Mesorhizobium sp. L-8-10]BCH30808.1 diaminopropionate ammonia-lyase [Mesorhizobium sp. L-8-10]
MFHAVTDKGPAPRPQLAAALGDEGRAKAQAFLEALPGYQPTPLVALPALARASGIGALHVKDEGKRLGLKSFKALGGAYAVISLVLDEASRRLGRPLTPADITSKEVRALAASMTVACATDGNHGRSVAWGAELAGTACEIFIHAGVSEGRAAAMATFGAHINRVQGSYDDSVALAAEMAREHGWTVVSDTSWEGYETIPLTVMQGYTAMIGEALDALAEPPTHLFLQAGVGGMAAAVASYATQRLGAAAPKVTVVEPARAACLHATAKAGKLVTIPHGEPTVMAMLECATPSPIGWEVLRHLVDGYVTLEEDEAVAAMRRLAQPHGHDRAIVAGESGATGLAGMFACLTDPSARDHLGLGAHSRILVFNSEGATDPTIYTDIVGRSPEEVAS